MSWGRSPDLSQQARQADGHRDIEPEPQRTNRQVPENTGADPATSDGAAGNHGKFSARVQVMFCNTSENSVAKPTVSSRETDGFADQGLRRRSGLLTVRLRRSS
ncbi:MAG: hypothetical protein AAGG99_07800 [Pseudomonadota bacterium]